MVIDMYMSIAEDLVVNTNTATASWKSQSLLLPQLAKTTLTARFSALGLSLNLTETISLHAH